MSPTMVADADPGERAAHNAPPRCTEAAIHSIQLPASVAVDEIRVSVDRRSPVRGAADVEVLAGDASRELHVAGAMSRNLSFSPPLRGAHFTVGVMPDFDAPTTACVDTIELYSNGRPVAAVQP